jgi:DNA-binding transcriptional MerR regulator
VAETLTVRDVADQLGVSHTTIKKWVEALFPGEPERDSHGRWRLTQEQVRVLETVKALRAEDKGINTIARIIGPVNFTEVSSEDQPQPDRSSTEVHPQSPDLRELIRAEVSGAIQSNNDLAEKYARATFEIGTLQERVAQLQEREHRLLTAGEAKDTEADRLRRENETLRDELAAEKSKPWWRKLIGS